MIKIIIGANYGDEGKGQTTFKYCNKNSLNILTNGGAQRGHTVISGDLRHVFHHFGSGTFKGATSYLYEDFLIDPVSFLKELEELAKVIEIPNVYRDAKCRWVTPYDVIVNQTLEKNRSERHGSCGMGIWETVLRYENMLLPTLDGFNSRTESDKICLLSCIRDYAYQRLDNEKINLTSDIVKLLDSEILIENYIQDVKIFCSTVKSKSIHDFDCNSFIFENAQGLLLNSDSENIHTTPSETGCKRIVDFLEENYKNKEVEIIYVSRPYLTRHGNGPFPEECSIEELKTVRRDLTNIENEWQGKLRYGKLNMHSLMQRIDENFEYTKNKTNTYHKKIEFTHLDEIKLDFMTKKVLT